MPQNQIFETISLLPNSVLIVKKVSFPEENIRRCLIKIQWEPWNCKIERLYFSNLLVCDYWFCYKPIVCLETGKQVNTWNKREFTAQLRYSMFNRLFKDITVVIPFQSFMGATVHKITL